MQDDLIALAERCESEPNAVEVVRLNGDILRQLGWTSDDHHVYDPDGSRRSGVPDYTGSVDAAMMLVPEGFMWRIQSWPDGVNEATLEKGAGDFGAVDARHTDSFAVSPALALCAAALRARAATMGGSDD